MRSNLTPFGEHSDAECWAALRRAHLAQMVESSGAGLDMELAEGGAPLSAGQKQLVAMARALLRHSKVMLFSTLKNKRLGFSNSLSSSMKALLCSASEIFIR